MRTKTIPGLVVIFLCSLNVAVTIPRNLPRRIWRTTEPESPKDVSNADAYRSNLLSFMENLLTQSHRNGKQLNPEQVQALHSVASILISITGGDKTQLHTIVSTLPNILGIPDVLYLPGFRPWGNIAGPDLAVVQHRPPGSPFNQLPTPQAPPTLRDSYYGGYYGCGGW